MSLEQQKKIRMLRNHAKGYCMKISQFFYPLGRLLVLLLKKTQTDCVQWLLQSDEMPKAKSPGSCNCFDPQSKRSITCNLLPKVHHARHKELSCLYKATTTHLKRIQSSKRWKINNFKKHALFLLSHAYYFILHYFYQKQNAEIVANWDILSARTLYQHMHSGKPQF